jgi:hypothetical protein
MKDKSEETWIDKDLLIFHSVTEIFPGKNSINDYPTLIDLMLLILSVLLV